MCLHVEHCELGRRCPTSSAGKVELDLLGGIAGRSHQRHIKNRSQKDSKRTLKAAALVDRNAEATGWVRRAGTPRAFGF